jgi:hypothetical protein
VLAVAVERGSRCGAWFHGGRLRRRERGGGGRGLGLRLMLSCDGGRWTTCGWGAEDAVAVGSRDESGRCE